ncbi:transmembrane protein 217-like isoform X2 [Choloepus didactylus]|nr:transmembrane protein 217-like isoform X2 [Choloepus didactylus]XP_037699632.1 transmembrane protein 217-like isoform X2 [Choloepus didactylus]
MRQQQWCGMTAKTGSVLSAVFSIISTDLYITFEEKQIKNGTCTSISPQNYTVTYKMTPRPSCWSLKILVISSIITLIVSFFLLYSVYAQKYKGLVIYAIWIPLFEFISIIIQVVTNNDSSIIEVRVMRWFGLVTRVLLHCFWMFFVITYAHSIYKSQSQGNILTYNRRISMGSGEFPRRKSKITSFSHHYNE